MPGELPAGLEVGAILRRTQSGGDFGTVLRKGDPDRGSLLLLVSRRGQHVACLERFLAPSGDYRWQTVGPTESEGSTGIDSFLARRARFDEDSWIVELDIADAERFIAETIALP